MALAELHAYKVHCSSVGMSRTVQSFCGHAAKRKIGGGQTWRPTTGGSIKKCQHCQETVRGPVIICSSDWLTDLGLTDGKGRGAEAWESHTLEGLVLLVFVHPYILFLISEHHACDNNDCIRKLKMNTKLKYSIGEITGTNRDSQSICT